MVMLDRMEKYIVYRASLDLILKEESYDKKRNVLNAEELFKLCHERYTLMKKLLLPLKEKLGKEIEITDISFTEGLQQETCIMVEYLDNGKKDFFAVSSLYFDDIEIVFGTSSKAIIELTNNNKGMFLDAFKISVNNFFDQKIYIPTVSKKFTFSDDLDEFTLADTYSGAILSMFLKHSYYEKMGSLYISKNKNSGLKKINKLLDNSDNINSTFLHARVYEDELPKILIKK